MTSWRKPYPTDDRWLASAGHDSNLLYIQYICQSEQRPSLHFFFRWFFRQGDVRCSLIDDWLTALVTSYEFAYWNLLLWFWTIDGLLAVLYWLWSLHTGECATDFARLRPTSPRKIMNRNVTKSVISKSAISKSAILFGDGPWRYIHKATIISLW